MPVHLHDHTPVCVVADQRAVGEALALALTMRGLPAEASEWSAHTSQPVPRAGGEADRSVGVVCLAVEDGLRLADVRAFLQLSSRRWVVVTEPPADVRWGALLASGAADVLGTGGDLDVLVSALRRAGAEGAEGRARSEELAGQGACLAIFRDWVAAHPAEARTLAGLSRMGPAHRRALRGLSRTRPPADPRAAAAALTELGIADEARAVEALRALDRALAGSQDAAGSSSEPGARHVPAGPSPVSPVRPRSPQGTRTG
ncbi:hypothetical protein GGQ22_15950 [Nocardioides sp. zg-579]|uniref:Response regulator transcription factor n=1 Tax=Nocardioides marmotae TaxID=2663857 RepID=A0A6I3JER0_9ACTN|nr:hypothetical protein [Nocardioides marmotae]MCR6032919.1 hypothetical protein [Gordonia jinghuaiqii]MTB96569.1 hypothetical protein [Nocardioides marmotae]QKE01913.1 hypothetical protein HPC71_13180 [Nocardioides marmotae]